MDPAADATLKKFQKELNGGTVSLVLLAILDRSAEPLYGYQIAKSIEGAWGEGVPGEAGDALPGPPVDGGERAAAEPGGAQRLGPASEVLLDHRPRSIGARGLEGGVGAHALLRRCDAGGEG